ncbi:MAG: glycerol-3-phosphate 1-O-acyltransferase PlsY [Rickettsiales bacterium]
MPDVQNDYLVIIIVFGLAYMLGSFPTGIIVAKLFRLGNLRDIGSGNIGATNVMRTGNKVAGLLTFLGDALKGYIAVMIATHYLPELMPVAAFVAVLGHMFPVWIGFEGGKGIATTVGILFGIHYSIGLIYVVVWAMTFWVFRVSAVAGIVATAVIPLFAYVQLGLESALFMLCLSLLVIVRHSENIVRLIKGQEYVFSDTPRAQ